MTGLLAHSELFPISFLLAGLFASVWGKLCDSNRCAPDSQKFTVVRIALVPKLKSPKTERFQSNIPERQKKASPLTEALRPLCLFVSHIGSFWLFSLGFVISYRCAPERCGPLKKAPIHSDSNRCFLFRKPNHCFHFQNQLTMPLNQTSPRVGQSCGATTTSAEDTHLGHHYQRATTTTTTTTPLLYSQII